MPMVANSVLSQLIHIG